MTNPGKSCYLLHESSAETALESTAVQFTPTVTTLDVRLPWQPLAIWGSTSCNSLGPATVALQWQTLVQLLYLWRKTLGQCCSTPSTTRVHLLELSWFTPHETLETVAAPALVTKLRTVNVPRCAQLFKALLWQPSVYTWCRCSSPVTTLEQIVMNLPWQNWNKMLCSAHDNPAQEFSLPWPYKTSIHHTNCLSTLWRLAMQQFRSKITLLVNFLALMSHVICHFLRDEGENIMDKLHILEVSSNSKSL